MDQPEIDTLLKGVSSPGKKAKKTDGIAKGEPSPEAPAPEGQVISEIDAVTAVTERETNKVMDQLDVIGHLVAKQQKLVTEIMKHPNSQEEAVQLAIHQIAKAGKEIQDKVFEAMDLMQFQDITRQKLERIVFHLRQIHDYIVELLGTDLAKNNGGRVSVNANIAHTGTTPDERKAEADAVIQAFHLEQGKKD